MNTQKLFWISLSLIALFAVIFLVYAATHTKQSPPFTLDTRYDWQRALSHRKNSPDFMLDTRDDSQQALMHRASSQPFRLDAREDAIYLTHSASSSPFALDLRQAHDYGDVSCDGTITSFDAAMILQYIIGLITLSDEAQVLADVSDNEDISAYDAALILQHVVGIISEFPIEKPAAASPANYYNQSYHVSLTDADVKNGASEMCRLVGENLTIAVVIAGEYVYGGEVAIEFDEDILQFTAFKPDCSGDLIKQQIESGNIKFSFAGIEPIASETENILGIGVMEFAVKKNTRVGETEIRIATARINEGTRIVTNNAKIELLPLQTTLLPNYPNPFNPDTWIPYQLTEEGSATIKIYNIAGQLIRALHLGDKSAGNYIAKEKAAYWDGRNNAGQEVASGLYFYTLQAGNFSATRKMVLMK